MIKTIFFILILQGISNASVRVYDFDITGDTWWMVKGSCPVFNCTLYSTLERSSDHGITWKTIYTAEDTMWISLVDFIDTQNGWLLIENFRNGYVTRTSDGGKTWSSFAVTDGIDIYGPPWLTYIPHKMKFINEKIGFIFTSTLKRTTDAGRTWQQVQFPGYLTYYSILNDSIIYAYAENQDSNEDTYAYLMKSTDQGSSWDTVGGKTWSEQIIFYNEHEGYRAMPWKMFHTINGGVTWDSLSWLKQCMTEYYFVDSLTGFVVSCSDTLFRTTDGWRSWQPVNRITSYFQLFNEKHEIAYIIAATENWDSLQLCYSPDNGTTWQCSYILQSILDYTDKEIMPSAYGLSQNYPNPFNSSTSIEYNLPHENMISIIIYDALGREIRTLVNELKPAGRFFINFDAGELSSGIYYYRIKAGEYMTAKKMILLK